MAKYNWRIGGRKEVEGLTLGKMYFFPVRVTGTLNTSDWSTPTAFRAY